MTVVKWESELTVVTLIMNCSVLWKNVLGDIFSVNFGVRRQGGVLSHILFSIYVDDLVVLLRHSGFGIFIGNLFLGCILYADDILLLSSSSHGLQCMLNICIEFGKKWDIRFNPAKTQCVSFGGSDPKHFTPVSLLMQNACLGVPN